MRLLIQLKAQQNVPLKLPREYIRNFIYSCIKGSEFNWMHDEKRKHFCFSNFYPYNDKFDHLIKDQEYKLIISSPFEDLIKIVGKNLIEKDKLILGEYDFKIISISKIGTLSKIDHLITATPIVIRLPENLYSKYGIESDRIYEFWDQEKYLDAFLEPLIKNGIRRYNDYIDKSKVTWQKLDETKLPMDVFQRIKYKKFISVWDKHFKGTMWEFVINPIWQNSNFLKYWYDSGFGERNGSSGSGFVNNIKSSK